MIIVIITNIIIIPINHNNNSIIIIVHLFRRQATERNGHDGVRACRGRVVHHTGTRKERPAMLLATLKALVLASC